MSMEKVAEIIASAGHGAMATCLAGRPRVRPMAFILRPDGCLWSSTYRQSGKVREWEADPHVEICFVDDRKNQVRVEGLVDLGGGEAEKRALLEANPKVGRHFSDETDPRFVHVAVRPTRVRWKPPGFCEYQEVSSGHDATQQKSPRQGAGS